MGDSRTGALAFRAGSVVEMELDRDKRSLQVGCVREEKGWRLELSRGRDGGQAGSREWKHDYSREQRVEALVEQREGGHKTGPEWRHQSTSTHQSPSPLVPWSTSPLLP